MTKKPFPVSPSLTNSPPRPYPTPEVERSTLIGSRGDRPENSGTAPGCKCRELRMTEVSRSEEHTSELQSHSDLVCRLLLEKKKKQKKDHKQRNQRTETREE